eukprot:1870628-Pyramimonas_sp.AAC.1
MGLSSAVLKTIAGAWVTSARMHDNSQRGCMMGCGGPDAFLHYWAVCPVFQYLLALIIQPLPFLDSPIARLG